MGWNSTWDYSLISQPIHYNFSGKISKTKPFQTTQSWVITKGGVLWAWHRSRWKKSGIVELKQPLVQHHSNTHLVLNCETKGMEFCTALANHHSREPQHPSEDFTDLICTIFLLPTIPKLLLIPQFSLSFALWSWLQVSLFSLPYSQYPVPTGRTDNTSCRLLKKKKLVCLSGQQKLNHLEQVELIFFLKSSRTKT